MPKPVVLWLSREEIAQLNTAIANDTEPSIPEVVAYLITTAAQPNFPGALAHLPNLFNEEENDEVMAFYQRENENTLFDTHIGLIVPSNELHGLTKRYGFITDLSFKTLGVTLS